VLSRTLRPPIILLCSPSGQEGTDLYRTLVRAARFARVVSMVDGPLSGGMVEEFIFDNFRTGMAGWEGILVALTQFSIIVVLDGRNVTPHLMFEARRGVSPLVAHKTIVVVDEETDSPILDRLVQSGDLPNKDCVRVLTPARLETAIRDLIESSDRVPVARVRLDKGPSGDRIAFLPGEPAPPRFALGDVWSNPLARGFEVSYQVPHEASVRIDLCGKAGDRIHTLVHGRQAAGRYSVSSSGRDSSGSTFPAGAYQVSLEADGERHVKVFEVPEHSE
jgi:hypothetical protein